MGDGPQGKTDSGKRRNVLTCKTSPRLSSARGGECHWNVYLEIMKVFPVFQRGSCVESAAAGAHQTLTYRLTAVEVLCSVIPFPILHVLRASPWIQHNPTAQIQHLRGMAVVQTREDREMAGDTQKVSGESLLTVISSPVPCAASLITSIVLFVCRGTYSSISISSHRNWIPNALMSSLNLTLNHFIPLSSSSLFPLSLSAPGSVNSDTKQSSSSYWGAQL